MFRKMVWILNMKLFHNIKLIIVWSTILIDIPCFDTFNNLCMYTTVQNFRVGNNASRLHLFDRRDSKKSNSVKNIYFFNFSIF